MNLIKHAENKQNLQKKTPKHFGSLKNTRDTRSLGLSYPKHALTRDMSLSNQPPILIQITNVTVFSYTNVFIASTLLTHPNASRDMQGITS